MLKSACCFIFIFALILAVYSAELSAPQSSNLPSAVNATDNGLLVSAKTDTPVKNEVVAIEDIKDTTPETNNDEQVEESNTGTIHNPGRCIACSQTNITSGECLNPSNNESSIACDRHNGLKCYMKISGDGFITRGCADELGMKPCNSTSNCSICEGDNCNNKIYPVNRLSCFICGPTEKNCSKASNYVAKLCPKYSKTEKCYIANNKGNYERGCLSQATRCKETGSCKECNTNGCNNGVYNSAKGQFSATTMISFLFISFTMLLINK